MTDLAHYSQLADILLDECNVKKLQFDPLTTKPGSFDLVSEGWSAAYYGAGRWEVLVGGEVVTTPRMLELLPQALGVLFKASPQASTAASTAGGTSSGSPAAK